MKRTFARILVLGSVFVLLVFGVFVVNQTAQAVDLASRLHPAFGTCVLIALLAAYAVLLILPFLLYIRLPPGLTPPAKDEGPEFDEYLARLRRRLATNARLRGVELKTRQDIENALRTLGGEADRIVEETAGTVFLATAVSQNGSLDAFYVLTAQSRMVWQIASLYRQRPSPREMVRLYANVAGTAFVAGELDDIDLSRQIEPVLSSSLGALAGTIPGMQAFAVVLANSIVDGTVNAFLTLRVGVVARQYCESLVRPKRSALRRIAAIEAGKLLGAIVSKGAARLTAAVFRATKGKLEHAVSGIAGAAKGAGSSVLSAVMPGRKRAAPSPDAGGGEELPGQA